MGYRRETSSCAFGIRTLRHLRRDVGIGSVMLTVVLTAFIGLTVAWSAFSGGNALKNWQVIRQYRPIHFIASIPVLVAVIMTSGLLVLYVPVMDMNPILWVLSLLFGWGDGVGSGNIVFTGIQWKYYAMFFLPVLFFALPSLARYEEEGFREGTRDWVHGLKRSVIFGLVHLTALIPLGAALALSIGGIWFTYQYFRGGVECSTLYHSVYNSVLVAILFVAMVILA